MEGTEGELKDNHKGESFSGGWDFGYSGNLISKDSEGWLCQGGTCNISVRTECGFPGATLKTLKV